MKTSFNVAENGAGSYRLLAILRWVMVLIFVSFGMQKFTPQSALGIVQFISNSPFISWLSVFGLRGEAYVLGVVEFGIAALLVAGAFNPILSAIGSLLGIVTFVITWSFFFTTPGVVKWSVSTDPMAWNLTGEFIFKDIVLLCVCVVLFVASLPQSVVRLRSRQKAASTMLACPLDLLPLTDAHRGPAHDARGDQLNCRMLLSAPPTPFLSRIALSE